MKASAAFYWRVILCGFLVQPAVALADDESLHALIDMRMAPVAGVEPRRCTDAEFLRRASLDLNGMPPTADEARTFIADASADKRARLVERLFASPHYTRHLAATLDVLLMERRANTNVSADEWQAWLLKSVRENKPWNVLAREVLQADGDDPAQRPAARFALDRASDPNLLTRDIGRIFFGRDMQCAQCHDHPLVNDYLQSDYHGLLAFVSPSYALVRKEGDKQTTLRAEKAGTDLTFKSVFTGVQGRTGPRMPDETAIDEPFYLPGEEYQVPPADNIKAVPKFSRRAKLAELATQGDNQAFNENIANRLWALMFGRGLVQPVDMHHPDNPATDPELLRALGERFAAMNFDIRAFLRDIALSSSYQRTFEAPVELLSLSPQAAAEAARLAERRPALEQAAQSSKDAYEKASAAWQEAEAAVLPIAGEFDTARNQYADAKKKMDEAVKAATDATNQLAAKQKAVGPVTQAATAAQEAIQSLPDDKELADAAQKFVARSQALAAEVTTLTKTVEEKSAAVQAPTEAWNNVKPTVEAARTKVTPLTEAMKSAERTMLAARNQAATAAEALAALDRRLDTARRVAELPQRKEAIAAAKQRIPVREGELVNALVRLPDHSESIAKHEAELKSLKERVAAANDLLTAAQAEHAKRVELAQSIAAAFEAADAARQKLPDDAILADASAKLRERASAAQTQTGESQRNVDAATAVVQSAAESLHVVQNTLAAAEAQRLAREHAVVAANASLAAAHADVTTKQSEFDTAVSDLTDRYTSDFTVASLKPLTPEQMCWTVFRVTGVYDRYWQAEVAELDKTSPLTDEQKQDPAQVAARNVELEQRTFDKLKSHVGTFVTFYGAAAGQPQGDFFATADQALFTANGGAINSWVAPADGNVTDRIIKQDDPHEAAQELYLGVLTRLPTEDETADVASFLTRRADDKKAAAQELVWGLLNSVEFRFNH